MRPSRWVCFSLTGVLMRKGNLGTQTSDVWEDHVRTPREDSLLQDTQGGLRRGHTCRYLDLRHLDALISDIQPPELWKNKNKKLPLSKRLSLQYLTIPLVHGYRREQTLRQGSRTVNTQAHEQVSSILRHQGNADSNHDGPSLHTEFNSYKKKEWQHKRQARTRRGGISLTPLVEMYDDPAATGNSSAVSYQSSRALTIQPCHHDPGHSPPGPWKLCSLRNSCTNVPSGFLCKQGSVGIRKNLVQNQTRDN